MVFLVATTTITTTTAKVCTETGYDIVGEDEEVEVPTFDVNMPLEIDKSTTNYFEINAVNDTEYEYKKKLFGLADFLLDPKNFEETLGTTKESLMLNDEQVTDSEETINDTSPDTDTSELFTEINENEKQKLYSVADELLKAEETVKGDNEINNTSLSVPKKYDLNI